MRRLLAVLALGGLLAVAVGILYAQGRAGLESERMRLEAESRSAKLAVLEGIRQELADELEALVERESTRPYYEYNNVYLPPDMLSNQAALVPSPLAKAPNEPLVQVYFQYRDDSLTSPTIAEAPAENAEDADEKAPDVAANAEPEEDEPDPTTEKTIQQLKAIEPDLRASCGSFFEPNESKPQVTQVDPLVFWTNRNPRAVLDQLMEAREELDNNGNVDSLTQRNLNSSWQAYQTRGGNKLEDYGKGKKRSRRDQQAANQPPLQIYGTPQQGAEPVQVKEPPGQQEAESQQQAAQEPADQKQQQQDLALALIQGKPQQQAVPPSLPMRVYPFQMVDVPGEDWPSNLFVARRIEVQDEAWLQGFAVDVGRVRDELLPRAISRFTEPVEPAYTDFSRELTSSPPQTVLPVEVVSSSDAALRRGVTLPLLHPFEGLSLVHTGNQDPADALAGSHMLLNGALGLVGLVLVAGSLIVFLAARAERRLAQQRADFVAALTHELKAPLTGVRALTELLHEGIITDEEKRHEYYGSMLGECDRLSRLVHNVLSAARLERGSLPVVIEPLDPLPVLLQLAERFGPRLDTAGFTFEVVLPDSLPSVLADREGFDHIVANLLDNAAKYALGATKLVRLEAVEEDGFLVVAVADRGPGIPAAEREKVFGRFFRSPDVPREVGGAGLGLAIARAHVEAQSGRLVALANPGGGARFELRLPLVKEGV